MALSHEQIEQIIDYVYNQARTIVLRSNIDIEDNEEVKHLYILLKRLYEELSTTMANVLPASIINSYSKGLKHAEQLLEHTGMGTVVMSNSDIKELMQVPLHMESISNIVSDKLTDLSTAFRKAEQYGHKNLDQAIYDVRN